MVDERSAGVVIFRKAGGKRLFLLLHYEEGHWDFAKGHVETGETELDAAVRETREETGISNLDLVCGFRDRIAYSYAREGRDMHKEVVFFLASTRSEAVHLSNEHIGYKWLPYGLAVKKLTFQNAKDLLKRVEAHLKLSV